MWYEQSEEDNDLFYIHEKEKYTELGFVYEFQDTFTNVSEKWIKKIKGPPEDKGVKKENKDGYILLTVETPSWLSYILTNLVLQKTFSTTSKKVELVEENINYKSLGIYKRKSVLKRVGETCHMIFKIRVINHTYLPRMILKKIYMLLLNGFFKKTQELDII